MSCLATITRTEDFLRLHRIFAKDITREIKTFQAPTDYQIVLTDQFGASSAFDLKTDIVTINTRKAPRL